MRSDQPVAKDIDEYIQMQPEQHRALLHRMRHIIRQAAPEAIEKISYGLPAFAQQGNLVFFGLAKTHLGFYPEPSAIDWFHEQLKGYPRAKGTVHFALDKALPEALITEIVRFRVDENAERVKVKAQRGRK